MSSPQTTDSPQVKLAHSFIEGFKKGDVDHLAKYLHKDYRCITYPRSIGKPVETREEWLQHIAQFIALWTDGCEVSFMIYPFKPPPPTESATQQNIHSIAESSGIVVIHVRIPNVQINPTHV